MVFTGLRVNGIGLVYSRLVHQPTKSQGKHTFMCCILIHMHNISIHISLGLPHFPLP